VLEQHLFGIYKEDEINVFADLICLAFIGAWEFPNQGVRFDSDS
jgi:hypothetical protein